MQQVTGKVVAIVVAVLGIAISNSRAEAQTRPGITLSDSAVSPENLTSSLDGSVYFGSTTKGTIYRAAPGASRAEPWILASNTGLTNVLGVLADDKSNTLWVCQNTAGGRGGTPVSGQVALRSFDLKTGAAKGTYPFPANAGVCNDIAVASDGTAYASESFRGRIHRLKPGATQLDVWITAPESFNAIDGVAILADGSVYANDFFSGKLFRIPVNADGSAGAVVPLEASLPSSRPDGLRTVGPRTFLQAEGQGRLVEITVTGNRAEVRVIQEGLTAATGVTVVGGNALVLVERSKAAIVPYRPR
jgi:streptogramin lyase